MKISELNNANAQTLFQLLFNCCGSIVWVNKMISLFPFNNEKDLLEKAGEKWQQCNIWDWLEAFEHHPKIGDIKSLEKKFSSTAEWAAGEQKGITNANDLLLQEFAKANNIYEEKFGFIFIVCATGKSATEMLEILNNRLSNSRDAEILKAAEEQKKITAIRLQKLLQ